MESVLKIVKFIAIASVMIMLITCALFTEKISSFEKTTTLALFWILMGIYCRE